MIINYNSLSRGRDAWLKNDVGEVLGSPPIHSNTVLKKSWLMSMLLVCCLLAGSNAWAQANAFSFSSTTGNSLTAIPSPTVTTTVTTGTADDGTNLVSPSGFTFPYNGTNYTQFLMTTNGWLKMGNVAPSGTIASSLTSVVADGVYAFGRDGNLNVANGGSLTHGATADGKYVFQIVKLSGGGSGSASATIYATSQIVLWGSTSATPGKIEIIYGASAGTPSTGGAIGISDAAGRYTNAVTGTTTATTTASAWPASGVMYTFLPPPPCSGTPSAGTVAPIAQQICTGSTPSALTATGFTTGATGLTFQWQQSTDNGATWTNTTTGTGGTTATYTPAGFAGTTIQYRLSQICAASGLTGYSSVATVSLIGAPATQASALTTTLGVNTLAASWTNGNGNRRMVIVSNVPINDPVNGTGPALTTSAAYTTGQQIVYDGTGTSVAVTGLTCDTTYYVKVYDYQRCGTSAPYSYYYNVTSGTNAATVVPGIRLVTLPMTNNFSGFTGANLSTVFPGWYEAVATGVTLAPTGTTSAWANTTLGGFTTAKINLYSAAKNDWIVSPKAALTATSRVTFKAAITTFNATTPHATGMQGTDDKVQVLVSTDGCGAVWTPLYTFEASNTTTLTNVLRDFIVDIPATYNGQTVQIAFQATDRTIDDAPDYDFHIADIRVELTPSCNGVTGVNVPSLTTTTADIAWTASSSAPANGYDWEVRTSGAAGSGATGLITSGSAATGVVTATAAGLTGNTVYTVYVRSHCAGSDYSTWTSGTAFTTPCSASDVPYTLDFESATVPAMPACTAIQNAGTGNNWVTANNPGSGFTSKTLRYSYNSTNAANAWFFTQGISLTANTTYALSYKYGANSTYVEKLKVAYATTATAASMTTILADHPSVTGTVPSTNIVYFTPIVSGVYFLGFNAYSALDQNALFVDDIAVNVAPICRMPSALAVTPGINNASLSWTAPDLGAAGYEWAVTTSDVPPASGTAVATTTATVGSLAADTFYYLHVRSTCSGSDVSDWVSKLFITGYCMSTSTISSSEYISSFVTTGGTSNISNTTTYDSRGYSNYSSMVASNYAGVSTAFTITPSSGSLYLYGASIFIDWNNDLDFDDANERVYSAPTSTTTSPRTGTIAIPAGTPLGNYRMRVRTDYINYASQISACGNIQVGETEDYTFTVLPVPPAITSFTPTALCSNDLATTVVTITGTNFTGVTEVKLNDVVTPHTVVSDTSITVNLDAASTSGFFNLYKISDGSSAVTVAPLEITQSPEVEPITGPTAVCLPASNTITLASETLTGVWSSSNVDVATVSSGGVVTPVAAGTVTINYTVTDSGCSTVVSYEVTVNNPIEITASTATQTVVTGGNTSFSVTATGSGAPSESGLTYQWQSTVDGETFVTLTNDALYGGTNTSTLTLTGVPEELNYTLYNVIITGACTEVISDLAVLFVGDTGIDTQPSPAFICNSGAGIASFTVEASSDVTTYEWQEDQGGDNWQVLTDAGIYSGTSTPTLTLTGLTTANTGWRYKVVVTGIGSAESNPVSLTVSQGATVTSEPANQTVCYTGGATNFTVAATNVSSYQWQYSADGSLWDNVVNSTPTGVTYSGTTSATLNVSTTSATPSTGMHLYRAIVNSAAPCAAVTTAAAQLSINVPTVTLQPSPVAINAGNTATFTVNATGMTTPTYQWQYATAVGGPYANVTNASPAGVTYTDGSTNALSVVIANTAAAGSAHYYKVIVTSGAGCTTESNPAQLTIKNYCTPTTPLNTTAYFTAFNTTGGQTNISNTSTYSAGGYGNFTNLSASQLQGQTVNFSTTTTGGTAGVAVWVDWNQDATFDASERVFNTTAYSTSPTGSFSVPATALPGTTRMRILMDWNTANPSNPCLIATTTPRGEVEDYSFTVMVPPPCTTPVAGTVSATKTNVCVSGSTVLTVTGYTVGQTGITFQWHNSAGPIAGQTGFTYTTPVLTAPESYFFRATCANGNVTADSNTIAIGVSNPSLVSTTPGTRCGTGTVNLSATGSAGTTVSWYAAASGGSPLATTPTFITPVINATTNYYAVAEVVGNGRLTIGAGLNTSSADPISFANGGYGGMKGQYMITAAELSAAGLRAGNINSFGFDVSTAGAAMQGFTVQMGNTALTTFGTASNIVGGLSTVFNSATVTPVVGINTLTLNTPFAWDGTSNIIVSTSWSNANSSNTSTALRVDPTSYVSSQSYRKDNETAANMLAFTGSTAASGTFAVSSNRPKFILGSTNAATCSSSRTLVAATVTAPPTLTLSAATAATCAGGSATVTVTSPEANFDTYVWTPAASGSAATGFTFSPSVTTTYNLLATNASGCTNTATVVVTVNPLPTAVTVTPATPAICVGETVALTATGGMTSSQMTSGEGTSTSVANSTSATLGPNPLQNYYGGTKQQWIYRASELTALGFVSGSRINSIALNLATANTTPLTGLTVKMKNSTTQSFASTSAWETGMTEVISQISHTPSVGLNTFTLSTPFVWDGTSSLVVEMNYSNDNGGSGTTNTARFSATTYASTIFYRVDDETAAYVNTYAGSAYTTYNSRNDVVFSFEKPGAISWTPTTGLFTDAGATTPYTGGDFRVVYAKPTNPSSYSASVTTAEGCPGAAGSATITINTPTVWYVDADNDNYGNSALPTVLSCTKPAFYAAVGGDCDDTVATGALVNPGMAEIFYNGIDDNCDGNIDEGRQLTTTILANRCGTKLSKIYQSVNCDFRIANITGYRFRVTKQSDPNDVQTIDRPNAYFNFNQLTHYDYGTTYVIDVMLKRNNVWLNYYGSACTVTTPDVATLAVCGGTVATKGTFIFSEVLLYATAYRFEVTNVATSQVTPIDNGHHYFSFNEVSGFTAGAQYSVKVSVKTTGDWSAYGNPCVITAPGESGPEIPTDKVEVATSNVFKVAAYPNPYADAFGLNITTESHAEVNVKVYDMLGKLIEIRNASVTDLKEQRIGERYAAGVYNIIVTQAENVKTLRVIKR